MTDQLFIQKPYVDHKRLKALVPTSGLRVYRHSPQRVMIQWRANTKKDTRDGTIIGAAFDLDEMKQLRAFLDKEIAEIETVKEEWA